MSPTEDDVRLTKTWAASQYPPVGVFETNPNYGWEIEPIPDWLIHADEIDYIHSSEEMAWQVLTTALKPVFASVRPVIAAEALERLGTLADAAVTACEATTLNVRPGQCLKLFAALHLRKGTP